MATDSHGKEYHGALYVANSVSDLKAIGKNEFVHGDTVLSDLGFLASVIASTARVLARSKTFAIDRCGTGRDASPSSFVSVQTSGLLQLGKLVYLIN